MLAYLKKHILEEIDDANDYMRKAAEHKGTTCGETFMALAKMETQHASALYKMFRNTAKPSSVSDKEYSDMLSEILNGYSDGMEKFEAYKKIYYE